MSKSTHQSPLCFGIGLKSSSERPRLESWQRGKNPSEFIPVPGTCIRIARNAYMTA